MHTTKMNNFLNIFELGIKKKMTENKGHASISMSTEAGSK